MDKQKIGLIINTIESQLELLRLELGENPVSGPQIITDSISPIVTRSRTKLSEYITYEPDYHEEDD